MSDEEKSGLKGRFREGVNLSCQVSVKSWVDQVVKEEKELGWRDSFSSYCRRVKNWVLVKLGRDPLRRHRWCCVENNLGADGIASALEAIQGEEEYESWFVGRLKDQLECGEFDQAAYEVFQVFKKLKNRKLKSFLFIEFENLRSLFLEGFEDLEEFRSIYKDLDLGAKVKLLPHLDEGHDFVDSDGKFCSVPGQLYAVGELLEQELLKDQGVELSKIFGQMTTLELEELFYCFVDLYYPERKALLKMLISSLPDDVVIPCLDELDL